MSGLWTGLSCHCSIYASSLFVLLFAYIRSGATWEANRLLHLFWFHMLPFTHSSFIWIYDNDFFFFKCFFTIAVFYLYLPTSAMFILAQPSHDWTHWPLKHQFIFINMGSLAVALHWDTEWDSMLCAHTHCPDPALHSFEVVKVWFDLWTRLSLYGHSES